MNDLTKITANQLAKDTSIHQGEICKKGMTWTVKKDPASPVPESIPFSKLVGLEPHRDCLVGDPEDFVHVEWPYA